MKSKDVFISAQITVLCDVRARHLLPTAQNHPALLPVGNLMVAVDEKGLRERRENTSSRFQAFYNALGHENWKPCCLNDEMAHQRDLG